MWKAPRGRPPKGKRYDENEGQWVDNDELVGALDVSETEMQMNRLAPNNANDVPKPTRGAPESTAGDTGRKSDTSETTNTGGNGDRDKGSASEEGGPKRARMSCPEVATDTNADDTGALVPRLYEDLKKSYEEVSKLKEALSRLNAAHEKVTAENVRLSNTNVDLEMRLSRTQGRSKELMDHARVLHEQLVER